MDAIRRFGLMIAGAFLVTLCVLAIGIPIAILLAVI